MSELTAARFPGLYDSFSYVPKSVEDQGFVMLNLGLIPVLDYVTDGADDLYYSPTVSFVSGTVADKVAHITLLGGLLEKGKELKPEIDRVLEDWRQPDFVVVESVGFFEGKTPGEEYSAIIAHIQVTDELLEGHDRLRMLPHIDFFPTYRPHMTLAYVKPEATTEWVESLSSLTGQVLTVLPGLNYGS